MLTFISLIQFFSCITTIVRPEQNNEEEDEHDYTYSHFTEEALAEMVASGLLEDVETLDSSKSNSTVKSLLQKLWNRRRDSDTSSVETLNSSKSTSTVKSLSQKLRRDSDTSSVDTLDSSKSNSTVKSLSQKFTFWKRRRDSDASSVDTLDSYDEEDRFYTRMTQAEFEIMINNLPPLVYKEQPEKKKSFSINFHWF